MKKAIQFKEVITFFMSFADFSIVPNIDIGLTLLFQRLGSARLKLEYGINEVPRPHC